ncbi:hypothetical protein C0J52_15628 [Blattella germanica]|nr:hypothetical protein C0J52_15628 [Blattella germanica]
MADRPFVRDTKTPKKQSVFICIHLLDLAVCKHVTTADDRWAESREYGQCHTGSNQWTNRMKYGTNSIRYGVVAHRGQLNYKRKSDRKPVTPEMLAEAEEKIASGMSKRKVAEYFNIDESTLRKRLKKGTGVSTLGRTITQFQVAELFGKAYMKNSTTEKAVKAFEVCGIVPLDRLKFGEEDFLPSEVTDQRSISPFASGEVESHNEEQSPQPSTSGVSRDSITDEPERECSPCEPTENRGGKQYSPSEIIPVPKVEFKRKRLGKGKKSTILTATPSKLALELERNKSKAVAVNRKLTFNANTKEKKERSKTSKPSEKTICPGCDLEYEDPPTEDWIKCDSCDEWWHENCTSYEGGRFVCDLC